MPARILLTREGLLLAITISSAAESPELVGFVGPRDSREAKHYILGAQDLADALKQAVTNAALKKATLGIIAASLPVLPAGSAKPKVLAIAERQLDDAVKTATRRVRFAERVIIEKVVAVLRSSVFRKLAHEEAWTLANLKDWAVDIVEKVWCEADIMKERFPPLPRGAAYALSMAGENVNNAAGVKRCTLLIICLYALPPPTALFLPVCSPPFLSPPPSLLSAVITAHVPLFNIDPADLDEWLKAPRGLKLVVRTRLQGKYQCGKTVLDERLAEYKETVARYDDAEGASAFDQDHPSGDIKFYQAARGPNGATLERISETEVAQRVALVRVGWQFAGLDVMLDTLRAEWPGSYFSRAVVIRVMRQRDVSRRVFWAKIPQPRGVIWSPHSMHCYCVDGNEKVS